MKLINVQIFMLLVALAISCNTNDNKSEPDKRLKIVLDEGSYSLGKKIYFQIVNESDSVAYFTQCASDDDILIATSKKVGVTWQTYTIPACPAFYPLYGLKFEPGSIYEDSVTFNAVDTFRIEVGYSWYGNKKSLLSEEIVIK